ncbi:MAG TPA: ABC transporter permease [Alphaproteobacteria bacterium]|nr:ABC transporter permease [Alphaproteobacteria bacterium]
MHGRETPWLVLLAIPALAVFAAFFLLPMARLVAVAGEGPQGAAAYLAIATNPRYLESLIATVVLAAGVTLATLVICGIVGVFLVRQRFPGRSLLIALMTLPLSFPGVVVGFMVIMLAGRQGLIAAASRWLFGSPLVFAYSMGGLFLGYLYFSIPRVILTVMAAAEKLDREREEAARSLGASPLQVVRDVLIPGLMPALISSGAICFATAMGAFGTAFTLATNIDVLPMTIYTEFTLNANVAVAASLSIVLGLITWLALALARSAAGSTVAAAA